MQETTKHSLESKTLDDLQKKYSKICEKIPKKTKKSEKKIRKEISESKIRDLRNDKKKPRKSKTIRLTGEQRDIARRQFKAFWEKMKEYESFYDHKYGKGAETSPLYDVFTYSRLALESYTRSMFACFRCGEIESVNKLKNVNWVAYHVCDDGDLGTGCRTSWLYIYVTFLKNSAYREAIETLDKIIELSEEKI